MISTFVDHARSGDDSTIHGDGEQTRDFVYVEDGVQANILAITTNDPLTLGEAYNIGSGTSVSIRKLAELTQDITKADSDTGDTDPRAGDIDHSEPDIEKVNELLGPEPTVPIKAGLERTVSWYRHEREG